MRSAILETLKEEEKMEKRKKASDDIDRLRKLGIFDGRKDSTQIIREWRDKRR